MHKQTASHKPRFGESEVGLKDILRKRLSALILDFLKFSQNFIFMSEISNGRCPWICNTVRLALYFEKGIAGRDIAYAGVGFCVAF